MRTREEVQADMDALDAKRIRPVAELVASGNTDLTALHKLKDIDAQMERLREEWRAATSGVQPETV